MVVTGARNEDIAKHLRVSEGTVKSHLHSIYVKLKIGGRRDRAFVCDVGHAFLRLTAGR